MRMTAFVFALVLLMSGPAAAQEWEQFVSLEDGFKINFPGKPRVTETTSKSQVGYILPTRVYSVDKGRERYSVTVLDYRTLEQQAVERYKTCAEGTINCRYNSGANLAAVGVGYSWLDERGALVYWALKLIQRDAKLTGMNWDWQDLVEGTYVQLVNNADQSTTFAFIAMHQRKAYIVEGTVPAGYPVATLFQASLGWVDKNGNPIRYAIIYSNSYHGLGVYPEPPRQYPEPPRQ